MNRFSYSITPRGEVKLELPGHTIYLGEARARELEYLLTSARYEQRRHPLDVHRLRQEAMTPEDLSADMTSKQRKGLRRRARGKSLSRTENRDLHEMKLLSAGQLTRRGHRILNTLNQRQESP